MSTADPVPAAHDGGDRPFQPLAVKVLVVSDTRDLASDKSGALIEERFTTAGHSVLERRVVRDDARAIAAAVRDWADEDAVQAVVVTGGTGVTARDVTPEAVEPLYDKPLPGFGELFRWLSFDEIGSSTIQSRASAGVVDGTLVFLLPGSSGACRLGMDAIILPQLDARTKPCSFPALLERL